MEDDLNLTYTIDEDVLSDDDESMSPCMVSSVRNRTTTGTQQTQLFPVPSPPQFTTKDWLDDLNQQNETPSLSILETSVVNDFEKSQSLLCHSGADDAKNKNDKSGGESLLHGVSNCEPAGSDARRKRRSGGGDPGDQRQTYLITYSQADRLKCKSREEFARFISQEFGHGLIGFDHETCDICSEVGDGCHFCDACNVSEWACSQEKHKNGGIHYHLSLKLKAKSRWKMKRNEIARKHGINVNFREFTTQYYDALAYVIKTDSNYITSKHYTPLSNSPPPTYKASKQRRVDAKGSASAAQAGSSKRNRPISREELFNVVIKNNIKNTVELANLANIQFKDGKKDLHGYIMSNTKIQQRQDMIDTCWSIEDAPKILADRKKSRIQKLNEGLQRECVATCEGQKRWLVLALQTLGNNKMSVTDFSFWIREALKKGRGKERNIMIWGESNCAKSFLLRPLKVVFNAFINPGDTKFSWIGAIGKDVIWLNDIRYDEDKTMAWDKFLNLLEGEVVHINMPKTHYTEDYKFSELTPIFATSKSRIVRIVDKQLLASDTKMMANRWTDFHFTHEIEKEDVIEVDPCGRCFCELVTRY